MNMTLKRDIPAAKRDNRGKSVTRDILARAHKDLCHVSRGDSVTHTVTNRTTVTPALRAGITALR